MLKKKKSHFGNLEVIEKPDFVYRLTSLLVSFMHPQLYETEVFPVFDIKSIKLLQKNKDFDSLLCQFVVTISSESILDNRVLLKGDKTILLGTDQ